jgi:hypothetical protein
MVTPKTLVETSLLFKWLRVFSDMLCSAQFLVLVTACIFLFFSLIFSGNCFKTVYMDGVGTSRYYITKNLTDSF